MKKEKQKNIELFSLSLFFKMDDLFTFQTMVFPINNAIGNNNGYDNNNDEKSNTKT